MLLVLNRMSLRRKENQFPHQHIALDLDGTVSSSCHLELRTKISPFPLSCLFIKI